MIENWKQLPFESCIQKVDTKKKIEKRLFQEFGKYPIVSQEEKLISGYWDNDDDVIKLNKPVIVFGDHTKNIKYIDFDFVIGADGVKILCPIDDIDSKFFYYQLKSFNIMDLGYARHYRLLKSMKVTFPPLSEQKHIATLLDKVFSLLDDIKEIVEKQLNNINDFFQNELERIFSDISNRKEVTLGEIAILKGRIGWRGLTADEYTKEGPLFLSVYSLNYGDYVDFRDSYHISNERYEESPEIMLSEGNILICKDGAGIGKIGIVGNLTEKATVNSSLLVIKPSDKIRSKYLYYSLLAPTFQKIVQKKLQGTTTPHLYQRDISSLPIHLTSIDKQDKIIQIIDNINLTYHNLSQVYKKKLELIEEFRKSILDKAFRGELIR